MATARTLARVERNASLRTLNTFGVAVHAAGLARVRDVTALPALLDDPEWRQRPLLVLGAGSNVLFTTDFDGLVLHIEADRITALPVENHAVRVQVEAGHNWHDWVLKSLDAGWGGLENLAGIPGLVGAAPIQNIGAYGVEVGSFIDAVEVFDRSTMDFATLDHHACAFAYRDSVFKTEAGRYVVTAVQFRLPQHWIPVLHYPGVRDELRVKQGENPSPRQIAEAIVAIRGRKLPDPKRIGNAGSFFKNPVIPLAQAEALRAAHPGLPSWDAGPRLRKLSAAWLIEHAGCKGLREGDAGISPQHALVLVNYAGASGAQLWALAQKVRARVEQVFGVSLEPEPTIL